MKESVIPFKRERIATAALRLACRLGRCFCFAEVSTGHPHLRNDRIFNFFCLCYLLAHTVSLYSKGFQREVCPFGHSGRSGNPTHRVSDGSFPYFCPYRTVLHLIETNRFWRIKFSCIFVAKPRNTHVLLHFANFNIEKFYFRQNCSAPEKVQFFRRARSTKRSNTFRIASFEDVKRRLKLPFIGRFGSIKCNTRVPARHERRKTLFF